MAETMIEAKKTTDGCHNCLLQNKLSKFSELVNCGLLNHKFVFDISQHKSMHCIMGDEDAINFQVSWLDLKVWQRIVYISNYLEQ